MGVDGCGSEWLGAQFSKALLQKIVQIVIFYVFLMEMKHFSATKKFKEQFKKTGIAFQAMVSSKIYSDTDIFRNFWDMVAEI